MADFLIDEGKNKIEGLNKTEINQALEGKADAQAVANAFQSVNEALNGKASTQALNEAVQDINTALNGKADEEELNNKYEQKIFQTIIVGQNLLNEQSVILGANWNGTLENGLTHSSGATDSLSFNIETINNKPYLVMFEASNVSNANALSVCIGDTPLVDIYNGGSEFFIGIVSDGGQLTITPKSTYNGTITNIKLCEITGEGDPVTFIVKNVNTQDKQSGISGFWNVAIGVDNFSKNENGSRNVAIGYSSLDAFKSGTRNLAIGTFAMYRLESGDMNIAVGADSMWYAKKAKDCIALGANSMNGVGTDLEHNIAIGQDSMAGVTTGKQNIGIGYGSMASPQNAGVNNSTCVGAQSGNYVNSGCTYIGQRAGYHLKGIYNTCLGLSAGAQQNATGEYNVFIGIQCGIDNTGATSSNPKVVNNSIAIGRQARATKSNQMVLGSAEIAEVVMCGNKKINFNNDGTVTWETLT